MKIFIVFLFLYYGIQNSFSQNFDFYVVVQEFEHYDYYLELGKQFDIYIDGNVNGLADRNIKKAKLKSDGLTIEKQKQPYDFSITPNKTGKTKLSAKVKLDNGQTIFIEREYEVVDLPELQLEIDVTSPDSKFSWLKILNKETGEPFDVTPYDFHWLDFELKDSLGQIKENAVYVKEGDFFPSVTLTNLNALFQLGDELSVCISLIHKKYGLYLNCCETIQVTKLWE